MRLETMTAASEDPELSSLEIDALLAMCRLADSSGRAPTDLDWTPTWDLNRGAAEGWRWKAGKAASRFDFGADGAQYNRSQVAAACERMAMHYARRIVCSAPIRC
jgi:hypothetical protein